MRKDEPTTFNLVLAKPTHPLHISKYRTAIAEAFRKLFLYQEVHYSEFRTYTRSKPIKRYIRVPTDELKAESNDVATKMTQKDISVRIGEQLLTAKSVDLNNNKFKAPIDTGIKISSDHYSYANPRYGIIDIHQLSKMDGIAVRIGLNPMIPIALYKVYDAFAQKLSSTGFFADSLNLEKTLGNTIEHLTLWKNGQLTQKAEDVYGRSKLFTGYREFTKGIDIVDILMDMDNNITTSMVPYDIEEYQKILNAYSGSKIFMEQTGLQETSDYLWLVREINTIEENMNALIEKLGEETRMQSMYFRLMNPEELKPYLMDKPEKDDVLRSGKQGE